jgi:hypothetical protein
MMPEAVYFGGLGAADPEACDPYWEVMELDRPLRRAKNSLKLRLKLEIVPRPGIGGQRSEGLGAELASLWRSLELAGLVIEQAAKISQPAAQRRDRNNRVAETFKEAPRVKSRPGKRRKVPWARQQEPYREASLEVICKPALQSQGELFAAGKVAGAARGTFLEPQKNSLEFILERPRAIDRLERQVARP